MTLYICYVPAAAQNIQVDIGGPLPTPKTIRAEPRWHRQQLRSPASAGSSVCAAAAGWGASLETACWGGGLRYCFSEQQQHVHTPTWKLLAGKQLHLAATYAPAQNQQGQLNTRAARCFDTIPLIRLPATRCTKKQDSKT